LKYSIIIPAYNERLRIAEGLDKVLAYLHEQKLDAEVIVVNDGSRDETPDIVRSYMAKNPEIRLLENPGNRGKGYAVRNGVLHARGEIVLFSDADLSAPIEEAPKLFAALAAGHQVAIGSRWLRRELQTERQPWYRQLFGRVFNTYLRVVLGLNFHDTQCGFKAFTRQAAQEIFSRQQIEGWGFDPEILFLARRRGFQIAEVPVEWAHDSRSRISYFRDGLKMVGEILKVRWNALLRRYIQPSHLPAPQEVGAARVIS